MKFGLGGLAREVLPDVLQGLVDSNTLVDPRSGPGAGEDSILLEADLHDAYADDYDLMGEFA